MTYDEAQAAPSWLRNGARNEASKLRRERNAQEKAGIRAHPPEPFDPFLDVEWRECGDSCPTHGGKS